MISTLPITAIFAFSLTFIILLLAYRVAMFRRKFRVGYGSNNNKDLEMAIGAHANAVENIPLAIVLLMLLELGHASQILLTIIACIFVLARVIHAYGLSHSIGVSFGRTYGTMATWILLMLMVSLNVYYSFT